MGGMGAAGYPREVMSPRCLLLIAGLLLGCEPEPRPLPIESSPPSVVDPSPERNFTEASFHRAQDLYLSFDDPPLLEAEAATFLKPSDEVLGLVVEGEARAYDVRALSYHHVINDTIGGRPIAVTY